MEILREINIKYPEYSVITPQTLYEFTVRSLTVQDEEKMKGSILTPTQFAKHLNQIIWDCIVKKPDDIKTYEDFLAKVSIKDREALLYGLYHVTYKDINNYDVMCESCGKSYPISINIDDAFQMDAWGGDEDKKGSLLNREFIAKCKLAENITAIIKQPTLAKEEEIMADLTFATKEMTELATELLIIDRIEIADPDNSGRSDAYSELRNKVRIYKKLPAPDRKIINKEYKDNLGIYGVEIKTQSKCSVCGETQTVPIDLITQFFRALYE